MSAPFLLLGFIHCAAQMWDDTATTRGHEANLRRERMAPGKL